ncbi:MAG: hypothetical protein ABIQ59_04300 [Nocardioidaceae bacterium]
MPLGRGIVEVFEAIPDRIEVSGHGSTWKVTGGSFEAVLDYAHEAFGACAVTAREDRSRWWPRVTLIVTTDRAEMAEAAPVETFADPVEPEPTPVPAPRQAADDQVVAPEDDGWSVSSLEDIFAYQEERRMARRGIPEQRASP